MRAAGEIAPIQWLVARPHVAAGLLFALIVLVYLWPALVGGSILSPIAMLYEFSPWRAVRPVGAEAYINTLLSDVPMADYPWRWFAREMIHDGTFPAWNPYVFGGTPFFNNPQTGLFTPFNLPLWVLPLNYALGLSAAIKLWAGGFGAYLLSRQLGLGFLAGLVAGTSFAFCSMNITWLTHETLPGVAVLLPWTLLLVERLLERGRPGTVLWLAVATAIGLGGGHPGMQLHLLAFTALYAVARTFLFPGLDRGTRLRRLALAGAGMLLGVALMAVMLVPEALSSRGTLGTQARANASGTLPGTIMPFDAIKTVLFPDWWGRQSGSWILASQDSAGGITNFNERTFFAGVVALLLAMVGVLARGGWRRKGPLVLFAVLGLAIALHAPGLWWLVNHLPAFELVQNHRAHFVLELAVAVLAGFGVQAVLDRPTAERRRLLVPLVALVLGAVLLVTIGPSSSDLERLLKHFATGESYRVANVLALTTVTWFLLLTLAVAIALLAARRWPRHRAAIAVALAVLVAFDMLRFAIGYQPMGPESAVIPPRTPAIEFLQARADEGRISGAQYTVTNDWSLVYGLRDVRGYDPPNPTLRYYRLWLVANPQQTDWRSFDLTGISPEGMNVLSVLGARYLALPPDTDRPDPRVAGYESLHVVYEGADALILRNDDAPPRAMIAPAIYVTGSEEETRAVIAANGFSPRTGAVVETDQREAAVLDELPAPRGSVRVTDEKNARVTLAARLDRRGLVILNDHLTDGWRVEVDGREANPIRVNSVMRGVVVNPGEHEIVWSYAVPGLRVGALVSGLALIVLIGTAIVLAVRARRGR